MSLTALIAVTMKAVAQYEGARKKIKGLFRGVGHARARGHGSHPREAVAGPPVRPQTLHFLNGRINGPLRLVVLTPINQPQGMIGHEMRKMTMGSVQGMALRHKQRAVVAYA